MRRFYLIFGAIVLAVFCAGLLPAEAQSVLSESQASKVLKFENLNVTPNRISGVIANASPHTVKDVQLLIQYHWLWNNERHPGQNPPGKAVTVNLDKELKPGDTMPFSYTPSPALPERNDGRFMPELDVGGFTMLIPQQRAMRN